MNAAADTLRARRYLLGLASEHEASDLEEEYLASDAAVERLTAVEDALIEDYLDGQLSPADRQQFERSYLASPRHRERVDTVRQLRARASQGARQRPPVRNGAAPSTVRWKPWLALAASLILVAGLVWMRPSADAPAAGAVATAVDTGVATPPASNQTAPPPARVFAITLAPVGVRGGGAQGAPVTIPPGTGTLRLTLEPGSAGPAVPTRVTVRTVNGESRWSGPVTPPTGTSAAAEVEIDVALPPDDYLVTLLARDTSGVEREWLQYLLSVRHP